MSSGFTSLQALKSMGPASFSTNDNNPWARFYGQNPLYRPDQMDPEARKLTSAPDLPAAYVGDNFYIPNLVEELVMTTDNWYTTIALPLTFTDQISWSMNVTTFDARMPRNTPYKATSRILDSRKTSRSGKLERHGIAYEMEAGFMDTPEGIEHYAFTLNQMANSIVMLLNVGVVQAYLSADDAQREYEKSQGLRIASDIYMRIERDIMMFAIVQKEKHGLKKLDALVTEWMNQYQGKANMWIFPPMLKMYNDLVPPENTDYYLAGPRGPMHVDDSTVVKYSLNGNRVYLSRMCDGVLEFGQRNLLAREVEIGSYNTMVDVHKNASDAYFSKRYTSDHRAIKMYDEDLNEDVKIGLDYLIDNCHQFDERTGLVKMPKDDRTYSSHPEDRNADMLSYTDDNNPKVRKPVRLFGHIAEKHFSVNSLDNLCKTVIAYHAKSGTLKPGDMEQILNDGMALVGKINSAPVHLSWFFNVFVEHMFKSEVSATDVDISSADKFDAFIAKITKMAKRTSSSMRIMKGVGINGMHLPEYDYYNALEKFKTFTVAEATANRIPDAFGSPKAFRDFAEGLGLKGGSSAGSLAGFGSWDGLLALQRELGSGGSTNNGFTKNGYMVSDCKAADAFVNLIKRLTSNLGYLFSNNVYLSKERASSIVEDPTPEHVICEWILGITGIPLHLDASRADVLNFASAQDMDGGRQHNDSLVNRLLQVAKENNEQNDRFVKLLNAWLVKEVNPKDPLGAAALQKKISFYLLPLTVAGFSQNVQGVYAGASAHQQSPLGVFLSSFFPLADNTPQTLTYKSHALKSVVIDLLRKYITTNKKVSTEKKVQLLMAFFDHIGNATRLATKESLMSDADIVGARTQIARMNNAATNNAINGAIGGEWDPTDYLPLQFSTIGEWFMNNRKAFGTTTQSMQVILQEKEQDLMLAEQNDIEASEQRDNTGQPLDWIPLLYIMGIKPTDDPTRAEVYLGEKGRKKGQADFFIGGQYGDPIEDEAFYASASVQSRFFRTPLVLSARQAVEATELLGDGGSLNAIMNLRLGDPNDIEKYVDPSNVKALVKEIRAVNKNAQDHFVVPGMSDHVSLESAYASPLLFYPENMKLRDRALALSNFGRRTSVVGSASKVPLNSKRTRFDRTAGGNLTREDDFRTLKRRKTAYGIYGTKSMSSAADIEAYDYEDEEELFDGRAGDRGDPFSSSSLLLNEDEENEGMDDYSYSGGHRDVSMLRKQMVGSESESELNANVLSIFIKLNDATNSKLRKLIAKVYLTSYVNYDTLMKFFKHDILFPFGGLLFTPHKRYESNTGIKAWAGSETGVTMVGHTSLSLQNDHSTKTHFGHMTICDDSVIIRPKQVFVQHNVFISRCLGGAGTAPMHPSTYNTRTGETGGGCIIPVLIPYEETEFHNYMDVTGRFAAASYNNYVDGNKLRISHYSQCWRANQTWRFRGQDQIGASDDLGTDDQSSGRRENTVVIRGQQYNYSTATKAHTDKIANKGHWGPEGPGSRDGRNGGLRSLVTPQTLVI